jgi:hemoglobin-like flavoprotein
MDIDIQTLNDSFRRLVPKSDKLAQRFYEILFERYPDTLELFAGVRFDEQKAKLVRSLALVVRNIERPDFLQAYLRGLGAIHVAYGVRPELYPAVCESLLAALAETAGKGWSREEEAAWRGAFRLISDTMIDGATRVA